MKKILFVTLLLATQAARSEWVTLTPDNIANIQVVEPTNTMGAPEGVYTSFKVAYTATATPATCTRRDAIAIVDSKLADRTYSALMVAMTSNKSIRFYLDGSNRCALGVPVASSIMLLP